VAGVSRKKYVGKYLIRFLVLTLYVSHFTLYSLTGPEGDWMSKILVVDDEADMRRALKMVLSHNGYQVEEAPDGPTALRLLESGLMDLVLMDIRMPGMDGLQTLRRLRETHKTIPVIMVTGYGSEEAARESLQFGANHYLAKPFDNKQLLEAVQKLIVARAGHPEKSLLRRELLQKLMGTKTAPAAEEKPREKEPRPASKWKKNPVLAAAGLIAAVFLVWKIGLSGGNMNFSIPHSHASGLVLHQGEIWVSDWFDQTIYRYQLGGRKLSLVKSYHLPDSHITGFAIAGDYFYICDSWKKQISKRRFDEDLTLAGQYSSPGEQPSCLFWDGKYLWSADSRGHRIYKHQMDNKLTVVESFPSPANAPVGIYKDEQYLWSADADTRIIYRHKLDSKLSVIASYSLPDLDKGQQPLSAFTLLKQNLWLSRDGVSSISRRSFGSLKLYTEKP